MEFKKLTDFSEYSQGYNEIRRKGKNLHNQNFIKIKLLIEKLILAFCPVTYLRF